MASISIPYQVNRFSIYNHRCLLHLRFDRPNRIATFRRSLSKKMPGISAATTAENSLVFTRCSVNPQSDNNRFDGEELNPYRIATFGRPSSRKRLLRHYATKATVANSSAITLCSVTSRLDTHDGVLFSEKLDEWMRDLTAEIVRNLQKAPLLVQIYTNNDGSDVKLEMGKAITDEWPAVTQRWKDGVTALPDGIIHVEELAGDEENGTSAWGMVVQGKGADCGPVGYLMKTSRVGPVCGLGCTHFCLMKVEGFSETALSQLTNSWLLK